MDFLTKLKNNDTRFILLRFYNLGYVSFIIAPGVLSFFGEKYHCLYINVLLWFIFYYFAPLWIMNWFDIDLLPCRANYKFFKKYRWRLKRYAIWNRF